MLNRLAKLSEAFFGQNTFAEWAQRRNEEQRRQEQLTRIAQKAMERVDAAPNGGYLLTDVGLLAYRTRTHPKLVRTTPVLTDTKFLRPYVEFVSRQRAKASIRFEIYDSKNNLLFSDEETHRLNGKMHIVAKTWLPLEKRAAPIGRWWIVVYVDNQALGAHPFGWEVLADNDILNNLRTDGEINDDLRQAVTGGQFREMSLDELLADQEE